MLDALTASESLINQRSVLVLQTINRRSHTGEFPMGVGHRVENEWDLTKVAVVLLNGLIW